MSNIAVVTDSNSGITQKQAEELGVYVIPMPFFINEQQYLEDINLTQEQFFEYLAQGANVSTSQPSPAEVTDLWEKLLKEYDEIVHIPMSSGLSNSCETAIMLSREYEGKVYVVNNQKISVTMRQSVLDALELVQAGKSAAEIREILEREKLESSIYLMVDTLKYLKKGGRITPAAAMLGTVLSVKPVLQIQGEKLDAFAKVRGQKQAKKTMIEALKKDFATRFADAAQNHNMYLFVAHSMNKEAAEKFVQEIKEQFPGYEIYMDNLSLSIACHVGPGVLAAACSKKLTY